jgi:hypothetical protein
MNDVAVSPPGQRSAGRLALWLGLVVGLLGPGLYVAQLLLLRRLTTPRYMPILGTVGVVLVLFALVRRRGVLRFLVAGLLLFLAAGEWWFLLWGSRLSPYTGPVTVGQHFPKFRTTLADGSSFDETRLPGKQATVMVFFRGRW